MNSIHIKKEKIIGARTVDISMEKADDVNAKYVLMKKLVQLSGKR